MRRDDVADFACTMGRDSITAMKVKTRQGRTWCRVGRVCGAMVPPPR
jgi:hypothetical protein